MVRESDHCSSISLSVVPLLQERFRQLQRMKELRQEKELLRMLSESERSYINYSPMNQNYHELMFLPPKPHCQLSLSLWPDSSPIKRKNSPEAPTKSVLADAPLVCTSPIKFDQNCASDIDTSLRL